MAVKKKKESDWWNEFFPTARPIFGFTKKEPVSHKSRMIWLFGDNPK